MDWRLAEQVHGIQVLAPHQKGEADGLIGPKEQGGMGVWSSDCLPLAIATPEGWAGLAHSGWRGCAGGMPRNLVEALGEKVHSKPEQWKAFIGPSIHQDHYEVDELLLDAHHWPQSCLRPSRDGRHLLDLAGAVCEQWAALGLREVHRCDVCTYTAANLHSYRRSGKGPNQLTVLYPCPSPGPD